MIIAIDGPSGSGKSTIAKKIAKKLNISYLDTGAMYRGIGYWVLLNGSLPEDESSVIKIISDINMEIKQYDDTQHVLINGNDVTPYIRENKISMAASTVSKIPEVRLKLVEIQRKIAQKNDCILDGRDIGSYVLPNADFKFYMTASSQIRAERRQAELSIKGQNFTVESIKEEIEARDFQDKNRAFAPLKMCDDAILIDTSDMSIDEVTDKLLSIICK